MFLLLLQYQKNNFFLHICELQGYESVGYLNCNANH